MIGTRSADPLRDGGRHPAAIVNRIHDRSSDQSATKINTLAGRGPSIHDELWGRQELFENFWMNISMIMSTIHLETWRVSPSSAPNTGSAPLG